jgi:hypothetical protein
VRRLPRGRRRVGAEIVYNDSRKVPQSPTDSVALLVNSKVMVKTYPSVDPLHMPTDICSFLYRRQRFTENATEPVKEEA